ncbi:MAG: ribokinase [Defluviitaleaceae bacterium]|nr:ribokinase [Defluviitaleaceae bacterium]MCL2835271.1 ribokinase [Defluviitaleaceae bacterium]
MDIINFGSLNIDCVYSVGHIAAPGETVSSYALDVFAGGKGLNQSIALARAGAKVYHAGMIGSDGVSLVKLLDENQADTRFVRQTGNRTGHAVIQLSKTGQNSIVLHGGANRCFTKEFIDGVLEGFGSETMVLLQNETNLGDYIIDMAHAKKMKIALNPSPYDNSIKASDLTKVSIFILNEIEGKQITGCDNVQEIPGVMAESYPQALTVLTLGEDGAIVRNKGKEYRHGIFEVPVADSTAAGDTFTGFFLAALLNGGGLEHALHIASKAAALAVSQKGAANSIPLLSAVTAANLKLGGVL